MLISTIKSIAYTRIRPFLKQKPQIVACNNKQYKPIIAIICDPMTWESLKYETNLIYLSPRTWKKALLQRKPDFIFIESAWTGIQDNDWRGQIYKDRRTVYENRHVLLNILNYCKEFGIPTVFWAKEDPTYFRDKIYDFVDTALKCDIILTTSKECISQYQILGHNNVHLWTFGFSQHIYHPSVDNIARKNTAVFAGSWYDDHPQRCKELVEIFDLVIKNNIHLEIFDRYQKNGISAKPFPKKYQSYVKNAKSYQSLGDVYRTTMYAININTVNTSETMFARRVYEIMACGAIVISNDNEGLKNNFRHNIWFLGESFNNSQNNLDAIRQQNIGAVFKHHTWANRMQELYQILNEKK